MADSIAEVLLAHERTGAVARLMSMLSTPAQYFGDGIYKALRLNRFCDVNLKSG